MSRKSRTNGLISSKKELIEESLKKYYYNNPSHIQPLLDIMNRVSPISLRIIDWFVTNYSKKNNTTYYIKSPTHYETNMEDDRIEDSKKFIVFLSYKAQLKAYSKKQFDPFCRQERIQFYYNDKDHSIVTTIGQLNFFRWAMEHCVLEYVKNNVERIEEDMNQSLKYSTYKLDDKKQSTQGSTETKKTRRKRHELSVNATKTINKHRVQVTVAFD